jgi:hypothetical protein
MVSINNNLYHNKTIMDWKTPDISLKLAVGNINYIGKITSGPGDWKLLRTNTIKQRKNICLYCGGQYLKYIICFHLDGDPNNTDKTNMNLSCKMCYAITHLNFGQLNDVLICYSNLDQTTIVKKTIDYIIEHNITPDPLIIDPGVTIAPISLMELCSILLKNKNVIPPELHKYKIFFTNKSDIEFVNHYMTISKKNKTEYMFTDEESILSQELDDINTNIIPLSMHIALAEETNLFNKFYKTNDYQFIRQKSKETLKYLHKIQKTTEFNNKINIYNEFRLNK